MTPGFFGDDPRRVCRAGVLRQREHGRPILQVLGNSNIKPEFKVVFSGNVALQDSGIAPASP
jgi:hypothetical protein